MKFPIGDYLRRLQRELFPSEADLAAERQAAVDAETAAYDKRQRVEADRVHELRCEDVAPLRRYAGRLVLVNNFKYGGSEEDADRIRDALLTPDNFGAAKRIGISAVLSYGRDNHDQLTETAEALHESLASSIGERAFLAQFKIGSSDDWLEVLARSAQAVAEQADVPPADLGMIIVASALNMNWRANIDYVADPGTAFKLTGISEDARFSWKIVSTPPDWRLRFQDVL